METYSDNQMKYINSVDGLAHMSAVEIIGTQDQQLSDLRKQVEVLREACIKADFLMSAIKTEFSEINYEKFPGISNVIVSVQKALQLTEPTKEASQ